MLSFLTKANHFVFLLARAIVANYARHQNKLRHRSGRGLSREPFRRAVLVICNPYSYKRFLLRVM